MNLFWVYLGVRTCELFLCFLAIVRVRVIMLTSLFSLFYVTREFHRFLHRGRALILSGISIYISNLFTLRAEPLLSLFALSFILGTKHVP